MRLGVLLFGLLLSATCFARTHMPRNTHTETYTKTSPLQLDLSNQTVLQHQLCTFLKQSTSAGLDVRVCVICVHEQNKTPKKAGGRKRNQQRFVKGAQMTVLRWPQRQVWLSSVKTMNQFSLLSLSLIKKSPNANEVALKTRAHNRWAVNLRS